ncbi:MAG TPA: MarP family serine protease [Solirubrobacteraceae bacterium]
MTGLDWIIVVFVVAMALWGFVQGLIVGALSLAGFAAGAVLGARLAPLVLHDGSHSSYAPLVALLGAILIGGILAMGLETVGLQLRGVLSPTLGIIDGVGGSILLAALGLGLAWLFGAVALQTPGARELRRDIQRSKILSSLNKHLKPSGGFLNALARFDPFPSVEGNVPLLPRPNVRVARDPQVRAAARSTVRVLGTACGLGIEGSGWVAAPGLIVTNAHVVAGESDTTVQPQGTGPRYGATAVWFDPRNDVAILRSNDVGDLPALRMNVGAPSGKSGAIIGYPRNGPLDVEPGRLGPTIDAFAQDAYGRGPTRRKITTLRGLVREGNSGGPMVDGSGRVLTTIFATASQERVSAGYGVPDTVVRDALHRARGPVDTGPCVR